MSRHCERSVIASAAKQPPSLRAQHFSVIASEAKQSPLKSLLRRFAPRNDMGCFVALPLAMTALSNDG